MKKVLMKSAQAGHPRVETFVCERSKIVGKTAEELETEFHVEVLKVSRGPIATSPGKKLRISEADYISFQGKPGDCAKLLRASSIGGSSKEDES